MGLKWLIHFLVPIAEAYFMYVYHIIMSARGREQTALLSSFKVISSFEMYLFALR